MKYKVINKFVDKQGGNTLYNVGDEYPKEGIKPTKKCVEELSKKHPRYKMVFIEEIKSNKKE